MAINKDAGWEDEDPTDTPELWDEDALDEDELDDLDDWDDEDWDEDDWDDDDEEKYAKLRAKSDALPLPFVTDNPDRDFKLNGWFSNHLLNLAMQIESENDSWIPAPGLGLNDYADIMLLDSVALSATIDKYKDIVNQLYNMADYAITGDTDALYKRDAGPYDWQKEGDFKFWNHLGKLLTFTGTTIEPVKSIENLKKREHDEEHLAQ